MYNINVSNNHVRAADDTIGDEQSTNSAAAISTGQMIPSETDNLPAIPQH